MATAVWMDLLTVTQGIIQGLGFTWTPPGASSPVSLPSGSVLIREVESDVNVSLPNIQIVLGGTEEVEGGDFEDWEIVYPVKVVHTFLADQSYTVSADRLYWRQQIHDAFHKIARPEATTANVNDCEVSFNPPIEVSQFQRENLQVGGLMLKFRTMRSRGR